MRKGMDKLGLDISAENAKRQCLAKKAFPNKNKARDWSSANSKRYGWAPTTPYKCDLCGKYHLSSILSDEKASMRASKRKAKETLSSTVYIPRKT
jgi:hypothetical protein